MATSRTLTVTAAPQALNVRADPNSTTGFGVELTVPPDGQTVYVGGPDVAVTGATAGRPIPAGSSLAFDLDPREQVYLVVAAGTQTVNLFATGA
jgi:hypothetical protein